MSELVIGSLISVIEISRVDRVRACEGIVDFGFLLLSPSEDVSLLVGVHQASLISIKVIIFIKALVAT
jgi:hypothetical protein